MFQDDPAQHLCEIQLVHERLMTDRKHGGAHHGYQIFRAAFELLEAIGEVPDVINLEKQEEEAVRALTGDSTRRVSTGIELAGGDVEEMIEAAVADVRLEMDRNQAQLQAENKRLAARVAALEKQMAQLMSLLPQ